MARVSIKRPLEFEEEQILLEKLFLAFSSLGNWQEAEAFLLEFLTKQELAMLSKRLELYKRVLKEENTKGMMRDLHVTAQTVSDMKKRMARADVYFKRVLRKLVAYDRKIEPAG